MALPTLSPQTLGIISSVGSAATGIASAYAQSTQYKIKEMQSRTNQAIAKVQGSRDSLALLEKFNNTMASNAVVAAAQGRTGGSVEAVAKAAESRYNWDSDFAEMSSQIQAQGFKSQTEQFALAEKSSLIGGALGSIGKAASNVGYNMYSIGGSTKGKK